MSCFAQGLCQDIGKLILSWDQFDGCLPFIEHLISYVELPFYLVSSLVGGLLAANSHGRLVITQNLYWKIDSQNAG